MESYIPISMLNDFIFCPYSIYFHNLYSKYDTQLYHDTAQVEGKLAHASIDSKTYSSRKNIIQGMEVYSDNYGLLGKIDLYDTQNKILIERKKEIKQIYDGYIFQIYAQYFAMKEMGYEVNELKFYCKTHNKTYKVALPEENNIMLTEFEKLLQKIKTFELQNTEVLINVNKCNNCIYRNICDISLC